MGTFGRSEGYTGTPGRFVALTGKRGLSMRTWPALPD